MDKDVGLDVLLDLNGTEYTQENGYWWRLDARNHIHPDLGKTITPYEFTDAHQLLKDFLDEVDRRVELDKR